MSALKFISQQQNPVVKEGENPNDTPEKGALSALGGLSGLKTAVGALVALALAHQELTAETRSVLRAVNPFEISEAQADTLNPILQTLAQLDDYVKVHPFKKPEDQSKWEASRRLLELQAQGQPLNFVIFKRNTINPAQNTAFDVRASISEVAKWDTNETFTEITGAPRLKRDNIPAVVNALYSDTAQKANKTADSIAFMTTRSETQERTVRRLGKLDDPTFEITAGILEAVAEAPDGRGREMLLKALAASVGISKSAGEPLKARKIATQAFLENVTTIGLELGVKAPYDYLIFWMLDDNGKQGHPLVYKIPSQDFADETLIRLQPYLSDTAYARVADVVRAIMEDSHANGGLTAEMKEDLVDSTLWVGGRGAVEEAIRSDKEVIFPLLDRVSKNGMSYRTTGKPSLETIRLDFVKLNEAIGKQDFKSKNQYLDGIKKAILPIFTPKDQTVLMQELTFAKTLLSSR